MNGDDNYFDGPSDDEQTDSSGPPQGQEGQEQEQEGKTELGNIEAFPDAEPGKVYEVEIVKVLEKEVEYRVLGAKEEGEENPPKKEPEMAPSGGGEEDSMFD